MPTPEKTLSRAIALAQSLSDNPRPLSKREQNSFNQTVTDQAEAVGKPFRTMPLSGSWSIAPGLWFTREPHYACRTDGSIIREAHQIVGFTHGIRRSDPAPVAVIEQQVESNGSSRLSLVEVGSEADRRVLFQLK